jgi:hypothetical protein
MLYFEIFSNIYLTYYVLHLYHRLGVYEAGTIKTKQIIFHPPAAW